MIFKQEGVWLSAPGIVRFGEREIAFLEAEAPKTAKRRARLCVHQDDDRMHQMLIAFCRDSWNPPHAHERPESMLVLKGVMSVLIHGERNEPKGIIWYHPIDLKAGDFLRIPAGVVHQPLPVTDCVVLESAEK